MREYGPSQKTSFGIDFDPKQPSSGPWVVQLAGLLWPIVLGSRGFTHPLDEPHVEAVPSSKSEYTLALSSGVILAKGRMESLKGSCGS